MQKIPLSNKQYFTILGSGINEFEGEKNYYSTSSIKGTEILEPEEIITYKLRPSRANMQPLVGVVCFAKMSQTLKVFKIDEDFAKSSILSTGFSLILPNKELVSSEYLKYYFLSSDFNSDKNSLSTGTTQVAINNEGIKKIEIPLPPLPTQHLIVSEIEKQFSRLDEGLLSLRRAKENLKKYKASVLKSAVEGKLTEDFRKTQKLESASILLEKILEEKDNETNLFKETENFIFPKLPKSWDWYGAKTVCDYVVDCHNKTAPYESEGIKLVRTTNIKSGKLDVINTKYVSQETYSFWSKRCIPLSGDILFTREAPMGEAGMIPEGEIICMGQRMLLLRANKNILNKNYLLYVLISPFIKKYSNYVGIGTGVKHMRVKDVENMPIPLPPLSEQNEIVKIVESKLSVVEKLEKLVDENIKRSENLKQSILKKAFEGELVRGE